VSDEHDDDSKRHAIWDVGYGRPPEHSRFQKGQSGNPKGRPRKVTVDLSLAEQPLLTDTLKVAQRRVTRRENGKAEEISVSEAVVQATFAAALKGVPRSQSLALGMLRDAGDAQALEIRRVSRILEDYKAGAEAEIADAVRRGLPPARFVPHPDDIVIDRVKGPRFLGPVDEEEQAKLERLLRCRDVLIMQDALERRSTTRLDGTPLTEPGSALLLALLIDRGAPVRLRLSEGAWIDRIMHYQRVPKRQLLKRLYAAWQQLGLPYPRGYVMANQSRTMALLALAFDLSREALDGRLDLNSLGRGEWGKEALAILVDHGVQAYDLIAC